MDLMDKTQCVKVRFFAPDFTLIGELLRFKSLQFNRKWRSYGKFELHVSGYFKDDADQCRELAMFDTKNYIMLDNDPYRSEIITRVEFREKEITIKGFELLRIFDDRQTKPPAGQDEDTYNTNAEDVMRGLVSKNAIASPEINRNISEFVLPVSGKKGGTITFSSRLKELGDEIESICASTMLGATIAFYPKVKNLSFEVLAGVDVTYNNGVNPPYIFSREFKRVFAPVWIKSIDDYKNCTLVAGQGEGAARKMIWVNNDKAGLERKELNVDARDVGDESEMTLEDRGALKLEEHPISDSYECVVLADDYRTKWDLGWFVTVRDKQWGRGENYQITEVLEVYEGGVFNPQPVFGEPVLSINDVVKRAEKGQPESTQGKDGTDGKTPTFYVSEDGHLHSVYE
ncbi:siphovirus ReqiPepy6 Gp37-like family protein [Eubacterium aggregans]|uniref:siphovirus ReqiPepy6 Gp37-like family protein n=1 Tax=Eubacterium aggregans TaxID=81409 RepID=UPI003F38928B